MTNDHTHAEATMTIRRIDLDDADREALRALSERDSRSGLDGPVLGAEVEGRLLAAVSLSTGDLIADPFSRTDELRALLTLRAGQLRDRRHTRRSRRRLRRSERRSRPALGGSPAGQIVTQQRMA